MVNISEEVRTSELRDITTELAKHLGEFQDKPRVLAHVLRLMYKNLDPGKLEPHLERVEEIVYDNIKRGYEQLKGQDRYYFDQVFVWGLWILHRAYASDQKHHDDLLFEVFKQTLNVDRSPEGRGARGWVLSLIQDRESLFARLIELSKQESRGEKKSKIEEVIRNFEAFSARY